MLRFFLHFVLVLLEIEFLIFLHSFLYCCKIYLWFFFIHSCIVPNCVCDFSSFCSCIVRNYFCVFLHLVLVLLQIAFVFFLHFVLVLLRKKGVGQQLPSVTSSAASSDSLLNNFPFSFFLCSLFFFCVFAIFFLFSPLLVVKVCMFMGWWYFLHSVMLSPRVTLDNQRTDIQLPGHSGLTYSPPSLQVSNPNCHFS